MYILFAAIVATKKKTKEKNKIKQNKQTNKTSTLYSDHAGLITQLYVDSFYICLS